MTPDDNVPPGQLPEPIRLLRELLQFVDDLLDDSYALDIALLEESSIPSDAARRVVREASSADRHRAHELINQLSKHLKEMP